MIQLPGSVSPSTGGYAITQAGAVATVQALESVPALPQAKKDLQTLASNPNTTVLNDAKALDLEKQAHDSNNKTCAVQIQGGG